MTKLVKTQVRQAPTILKVIPRGRDHVEKLHHLWLTTPDEKPATHYDYRELLSKTSSKSSRRRAEYTSQQWPISYRYRTVTAH